MQSSHAVQQLARLALGLGLSLSTAFASVDVNTASRSELETVRGIGPTMSGKIVAERDKRGPFKSSQDLAKRVSGLGEKKIKRLQDNGLTLSSQKLSEPAKPVGPDANKPRKR